MSRTLLSQRRLLRFDSLRDALHEAQRLQRSGYARLGSWDLSQVCRHLSDWILFPIDGPPQQSAMMRSVLLIFRPTLGKLVLRRTLSKGMPAGAPALKQTIHPPSGNDAEAVACLQRAVERFEAHGGPWHPSPFFGDLKPDKRLRLQLIHCAHHLGFLLPRDDSQISAGVPA